MLEHAPTVPLTNWFMEGLEITIVLKKEKTSKILVAFDGLMWY